MTRDPAPGQPQGPAAVAASALPARILYVDDDRINAFLFEQACASLPGVSAWCAASGAEALALAGEAPPDLLILDLHLPDTDGWQLLAALRQQPGLQDTPAILCTADPHDEVAAQAQAAGFLEVWDKPASAQDLQRAIAIIRRPFP